MKGKINTERSCEYTTPFGCKARDFAKELMLQEMIEGSEQYKELSDICKKQCCCECNESCGYRCNQGMEKISNKVEVKKEERAINCPDYVKEENNI